MVTDESMNKRHGRDENHTVDGTHHAAVGSVVEEIKIRKIGISDLRNALAMGWDDFIAKPSHIVFLCIIYPIVGLILTRVALQNDMLPLIYPLVGGYALIGPIAAIGLYELSRRREQGLVTSWFNVFEVLKSPSLGSIVALVIGLTALFLAWLATATWIYAEIFPAGAPEAYSDLVFQVFGTSAGWSLIIAGSGVGLIFAVIVLTFGVVSFPMLLDRDVSALTALRTSARAVLANPRTMAAWGCIVAGILIVGSLPLLIGLTIALPVLGHATWHLYRSLIYV